MDPLSEKKQNKLMHIAATNKLTLHNSSVNHSIWVRLIQYAVANLDGFW